MALKSRLWSLIGKGIISLEYVDKDVEFRS